MIIKRIILQVAFFARSDGRRRQSHSLNENIRHKAHMYILLPHVYNPSKKIKVRTMPSVILQRIHIRGLDSAECKAYYAMYVPLQCSITKQSVNSFRAKYFIVSTSSRSDLILLHHKNIHTICKTWKESTRGHVATQQHANEIYSQRAHDSGFM